jgi:hypothetical protein
MAQLRDAHTSELIAEGTPLEVALIAAGLDDDGLLFDDVGHGFDPRTTIDAHNVRVEGLSYAVRQAPEDDDQADTARAAHRAAVEEGQVSDDAIAKARNALSKARKRLK